MAEVTLRSLRERPKSASPKKRDTNSGNMLCLGLGNSLFVGPRSGIKFLLLTRIFRARLFLVLFQAKYADCFLTIISSRVPSESSDTLLWHVFLGDHHHLGDSSCVFQSRSGTLCRFFVNVACGYQQIKTFVRPFATCDSKSLAICSAVGWRVDFITWIASDNNLGDNLSMVNLLTTATFFCVALSRLSQVDFWIFFLKKYFNKTNSIKQLLGITETLPVIPESWYRKRMALIKPRLKKSMSYIALGQPQQEVHSKALNSW